MIVLKFVVFAEAVLIETYWNVNRLWRGRHWDLRRVLIETYWNVNFLSASIFSAEKVVLIETYWNVNSDIFCG